MDRRAFLRSTALGAGVLTLGPAFWRTAYGAPAQPGVGYGPLGPPDANGIRLPSGFSSRVIAVSGQPVVGTGYVWHPAPDGGATYTTPDGGWIYVSNSEVPFGGVGAVRFDASGGVVGAHRVITGTSMNCAGGATPWGTWLTCEEHDFGHVWECAPTGLNDNTRALRRALGTFSHEAAVIDPVRKHVFLTEDKPDGRFYRFTPASSAAWPDLSAGTLEAAVATPVSGFDPADPRWTVTWLPIPNPNPTPAETPTRQQLPATTAFNGGEGCWFDTETVYFTTKGDNRVWALNAATSVLELVYDDNLASSPVLRGVDNVTVNTAGEIFVAEDGGDMQIVVLAPDRTFAPLLQIMGQDASEIAGPAFDPSGKRLYFSSQRGPAPAGPGITYEVRGPFNGTGTSPAAASGGLLSGLVHEVVEPPVRGVAAPLGDAVHAVDRGVAGLGL